MNEVVYTINEVAKALRVSRSTIYVLLSSGDLQSVRVGARSRRVTARQLSDYLNTREQNNPEVA